MHCTVVSWSGRMNGALCEMPEVELLMTVCPDAGNPRPTARAMMFVAAAGQPWGISTYIGVLASPVAGVNESVVTGAAAEAVGAVITNAATASPMTSRA